MVSISIRNKLSVAVMPMGFEPAIKVINPTTYKENKSTNSFKIKE